jgi:hypothetical protein
MAVAQGTPTTAALANGSNTTTVSFISTSGPLYVEVAWWTTAISAVTYGGVALTAVGQSGASSGGDRAEVWRLLSPTAGTANVVLTHTGGQAAGSVVISNTTGQDTTTPEGTAKTAISAANGTSTGSQAITGAATGDLTITVVSVGNGAAVTPSATGAGTTTEIFDTASNGESTEAFKATDAVTAVSASWTGSTSWALASVPLKVASAAFDPATVPPLTLSAMPLQGQQIGQY